LWKRNRSHPIGIRHEEDYRPAETRHVCAFFNNDEEEYRVLLPFIRDGLSCGHKAIHVVNPDQRQDHLQRLAAAGINATTAQQDGQLELRVNTEVYLPDGRFDQDRMLAVFEQLASGNAVGRFPLSRICCRMDWARDDQSYVDDVIEFKARVNDVWHRHEDAVICTYHLGQFGGEAVVDIMRTHPMVIIGGILQQNPFYMPPDEFLREFRQRRANRYSSPAAA
jgi:MEDS: MEthanogen/methylotroph, DcmR Sensory domain